METRNLALSATRSLYGTPTHCTATFLGKRYIVDEISGDATHGVRITQKGTKNKVEATTAFDTYHRPIAMLVTFTRRDQTCVQLFKAEQRTTEEEYPVLRRHTSSEPLSPEIEKIVERFLLVGNNVLADAAPARRARNSRFEPDPSARGMYENDTYQILPEYPY